MLEHRTTGATSGGCAKKFEELRTLAEHHINTNIDAGFSLSVVQDGERIVDLWGGTRFGIAPSPWTSSTLVNVFSVGKGVLAFIVAALVERGVLCYDRCIADDWPEFGAEGKARITLRDIMSHRSGMHAWRKTVQLSDLYDWKQATSLLAKQRPFFVPGSKTAYQARTFGFLVGELIRRATNNSPSEVYRTLVHDDPGLAFQFGEITAAQEAQVSRIVECPSENAVPDLEQNLSGGVRAILGTDILSGRQSLPPPTVQHTMNAVFGNPGFIPTVPNDLGWRQACIPSSNGHGCAHALAGLYGELVLAADGQSRLLERETLRTATSLQSQRLDESLGFPVRWGLGFTINSGEFGPSKTAFGHRGLGGSIAFADPERKISFAYTTNTFIPKFGDFPGNDPRADRFIEALYKSA